MGRRPERLRCVRATEQDPAVGREGTRPLATWTDLGIIMPRDVSPTETRRKPQDITNMRDRNPKATHEQDRQRLAVTDHGPKGRGRGRKEAVG